MMLLIKFFGLLNRSVKDLLGRFGDLALFIEFLQLVDDEMGIEGRYRLDDGLSSLVKAIQDLLSS